ncbi:MAG: asparagine synthase [bacterium]|nr:asparagine synthase [bacterium]
MFYSIVKNGKLIEEREWKKLVNSLKSKTTLEKKQAKSLLKKDLEEAVQARAKDNFGILLSGGIDSSLLALIAKKPNHDFTCYSVGLKNSEDLEWAQKASLLMHLKLKTRILSLDEAETIIKKVTKILKEPSVVKVGVASVVYAAAEIAKKDKIKTLFSGLGSEELFAGYQRHKLAKDVNKECWSGLRGMWSRDLERDFIIAKKAKIKLATPFLDKNVIKTSMSIPSKYKLTKETDKAIIREVALDLGLPREIAYRKKRAAQYGSSFDKAIKKLSKKHGFKTKKEYLASLL